MLEAVETVEPSGANEEVGWNACVSVGRG